LTFYFEIAEVCGHSIEGDGVTPRVNSPTVYDFCTYCTLDYLTVSEGATISMTYADAVTFCNAHYLDNIHSPSNNAFVPNFLPSTDEEAYKLLGGKFSLA